jgi:hypothetical protein
MRAEDPRFHTVVTSVCFNTLCSDLRLREPACGHSFMRDNQLGKVRLGE